MKFLPLLLFPFLLSPLCAQESAPAAAPVAVKAVTPEPRDNAGLIARHESFNEISRKGEAQIVFLGDSITHAWDSTGKAVWDKVWAPMKAANFGIGGDRTENVLWRIDHGNFDGLKPKLVVLMIGTNNTGHRMDPPAETAAGVQAILDRLQKKVPDAKVLLLAIFPRGATLADPKRVRNTEINDLLAKMDDGKRIHFLDINAKFLQPDGTLPKAIMPDLLHPGAEGYQIWTDAILEKVKALMGF